MRYKVGMKVVDLDYKKDHPKYKYDVIKSINYNSGSYNILTTFVDKVIPIKGIDFSDNCIICNDIKNRPEPL